MPEEKTDAKTQVTFAMQIPLDLRERIQALAARDRRPMSAWARIKLEDIVKAEEAGTFQKS